MRFGVQIRALRTAQEWSQAELAAEVGLDRKYISDIETGQANPTLTTLLAFASAFDIELSELLAGF